jgi:hypothetical protein
MTKIIEAKAVISAEDKTGAVFDNIAKKISGMTKVANTFAGIKAPQGGLMGLGAAGWGAKFQKDIEALRISSRELAGIQKNWQNFNSAMGRNGPVRAANYFRAMDDWKNTTLSNLREVRLGMTETEKVHKRFYGGLKRAGEFALLAGGIGSGAYMAARGVAAGAKQIGDRGRELARYSLAGMSQDEKDIAGAKADEISGKYPAVSRTEVLGHIRQLRARLGSFDHAIDNAETLSKAQVVLGTLGQGGEAGGHDLEQLVLGLESQGVGNNPEKFKAYMNAFVKAKSLFPDLKGEDFRQYMQRANASKYGLSDDYLQNVVPTMMQHEGASNFGNMQASAFSALVGGRQTKAAKAVMAGYGLMGEDGKIKAMDKFVSNPEKWASENLAPALENKGITMNEEHRGDVVKALTQMFSNRKVGEFFASMLVNQGIIAKDREMLQGAKGTEGADIARSQDPYVALAGLTTQAKDLATAFIGTKEAISAMNTAADDIGKRTKALKEGNWLGLLPDDDQRIIKAARDGWNTPLSGVNEQNRRGNLELQQREVDERLRQGGYSDAQTRQMRLRAFELRSGIDASNNASTMPPIFSDAERAQWEEIDREHRRGTALSGMSARAGGPFIPLPMADPRKTFGEMPPVQSLEGATVQATLTGSADVHGELKVEVTAGSALLAIVQKAESLVAKLTGSLNANGPGSLGHSSPDAAAPKPDTGASGNW